MAYTLKDKGGGGGGGGDKIKCDIQTFIYSANVTLQRENINSMKNTCSIVC
jgi:hypothetical protein